MLFLNKSKNTDMMHLFNSIYYSFTCGYNKKKRLLQYEYNNFKSFIHSVKKFLSFQFHYRLKIYYLICYSSKQLVQSTILAVLFLETKNIMHLLLLIFLLTLLITLLHPYQ